LRAFGVTNFVSSGAQFSSDCAGFSSRSIALGLMCVNRLKSRDDVEEATASRSPRQVSGQALRQAAAGMPGALRNVAARKKYGPDTAVSGP
jgi:hypothetical protein